MNKRGKKMLLHLVLWGILVALLIEGILLFCVVRAEKTQRPVRASDVIIVLGARVMPDGRLSTTLENRVLAALSAYNEGLAPRIIVCGAQGDNEPEAEAAAMKARLLAEGAAESDIFMDDQSYNTYQNLTNARAIMEENGMESAIVVSTDYHVARVLALCEDLGIDACAIPSAAPETPLVHWKGRVRETLSWVNYFIRYRLLS